MKFEKDGGEMIGEQGVRLIWQKGREAAGLEEWERMVGLECEARVKKFGGGEKCLVDRRGGISGRE